MSPQSVVPFALPPRQTQTKKKLLRHHHPIVVVVGDSNNLSAALVLGCEIAPPLSALGGVEQQLDVEVISFYLLLLIEETKKEKGSF